MGSGVTTPLPTFIRTLIIDRVPVEIKNKRLNIEKTTFYQDLASQKIYAYDADTLIRKSKSYKLHHKKAHKKGLHGESLFFLNVSLLYIKIAAIYKEAEVKAMQAIDHFLSKGQPEKSKQA